MGRDREKERRRSRSTLDENGRMGEDNGDVVVGPMHTSGQIDHENQDWALVLAGAQARVGSPTLSRTVAARHLGLEAGTLCGRGRHSSPTFLEGTLVLWLSDLLPLWPDMHLWCRGLRDGPRAGASAAVSRCWHGGVSDQGPPLGDPALA